jgi:ADP-ribose pyrophosphatase YjhB (NUDIX family)
MVPDAVTATAPEPLGTQLRHHAASVNFPRDRALAEEFLRFATEHADCLLRSCAPGHFTGSAWIVDRARRRALLTHHRKLDKWLQLGGHADGNPDLLAVAWREATEESGLAGVSAVSGEIFDLDRHLIPARGTEAAHWHYDIRFLFEADPAEPLTVTRESRALAWVNLAEVASLNPEESMRRMVEKTVAPI